MAMANETWKFVQAMKQTIGIRNETARMKVTPPLADVPLKEDGMRWNLNDDRPFIK